MLRAIAIGGWRLWEDSMPGASKWGSEFLVNTTTTNNQTASAITALSNGRYAVIWSDTSQTGADNSGYAVKGQILNADGSRWGSEFLVNTTTTGDQHSPSIAPLPDGRFIVAWSDSSQTGGDTSSFAVRGQVLNMDGSHSGGEFLINTTTPNSQVFPTITTLRNALDGHFAVAWMDQSGTGGDTSELAVRGRVFRIDGTQSGGEFLVNTTTIGSQANPTMAALPGGRFVVTWTDTSQTGSDTSGYAIKGQIFETFGTKLGGEFLVNTTITGQQVFSSIATLPDGRFMVTWTDSSQTGGDTSSSAVRGQVFSPEGGKLGGEILINTTTTDAQSAPSVAGLADGRFVVAWTDSSQTGGDVSSLAIRGQVFNPYGSKDGGEFLVNTTTIGNQFGAIVTALPDGRFVVAWTDGSQTDGDASLSAVRGQIFDPRETGITLFGTPLDDTFVGSRFVDVIRGGFGNDALSGDLGRDRLLGGLGNDTVNGGYGNDVMYGQTGRDVFVFDTKLGTAKTDRKVNFDKVVDFRVKDDSFWLDNAVFRKLGSRGSEDHPVKLKKTFFEVGQADDRNDYLLYNSKTGVLSYDADGSGRGQAVEFAQLSKNLKLTYHDFFVV